MPDYTLAELARLADVTPRTIRYYISQGLLPSPDAAGPATRYGETALARLRLIRRLQREHLPLAEIRLRLEALTPDDIAALAGEPDAATASGSALDYVRGLLGSAPLMAGRSAPASPPAPAPAPTAPAPAPAPAASAAGAAPLPAMSSVPLSMARAAAPAPPAPPAALAESIAFEAPPPSPSTPTTPSTPDRSTWERLALHPDIELHVRRPLDRATNKRVERLIRIARELFDDEA